MPGWSGGALPAGRREGGGEMVGRSLAFVALIYLGFVVGCDNSRRTFKYIKIVCFGIRFIGETVCYSTFSNYFICIMLETDWRDLMHDLLSGCMV